MNTKKLFGKLYDVEEKLKCSSLTMEQKEALLEEQVSILRDLERTFKLHVAVGVLVGSVAFLLLFFGILQ